MPHNSNGGFLKTTLTLAGGVIGAIRGAIEGARVSGEMGDVRQTKMSEPAEPELEVHPYRPELHFPPRPGHDWHDPLPARLPKPTYAPATLAFGICLAAAGVVTKFWVSLAGGILFVLGLSHWIWELAHEHK